MRFAWDPKKAALNKVKHNISFEVAIEVFDDPLALEKYDPGDSEDRIGRIGSTSRGILIVVYTERVGDITRIISARKASREERRNYYD